MNHESDLWMIDRKWDAQHEWVAVKNVVRMNHEYDLRLIDRNYDQKHGENEFKLFKT